MHQRTSFKHVSDRCSRCSFGESSHSHIWTGFAHFILTCTAYTQKYAISAADLIYQDTKSVIKVVRYGLTIQCYPDAHAVELVEKQSTRQREHPHEPKPPFCPEWPASVVAWR